MRRFCCALFRRWVGNRLAAALAAALVLGLVWLFPAAADSPPVIDPALQNLLRSARPGDTFSVIVRLKDQPRLDRQQAPPGESRQARLSRVVRTLQQVATTSQQNLRGRLQVWQSQGKVNRITPFWIFNGLAVTAVPEVIQQMALQPEVASITLDSTIPAPPPPPEIGVQAVEANLQLVNVPAVWSQGYTGQGIVVATMDTGVGYDSSFSHPALFARWRGGSNSWFDPYGQHAQPADLNGHGTRTMGIMIGGVDGNTGLAFGLAPDAQWVAVKIFNDQGKGTTSAIHQGFQWLLDPDGNPDTPDAPHVVSNSWIWYQGCQLEFQPDLQALRAAGILPIFAAGNDASVSHSPANYPEAFAVGAVDNNDVIWDDGPGGSSSRGPSACDGTIYPEITAPGVSIHTTSLYGSYFNATGTSMSAPHVAGALALLLQAFPGLPVDQQEAALLNGAVELGPVGPDNTYGYGRLDVLASLQWLEQNVQVADLAVTQTAWPETVTAGAPLTYTITISNSGQVVASAVALTDTLTPADVAVGDPLASQGTCGPPAANSFACSLGSLLPGSTATVTVVVTPATAGITLTNAITAATSAVEINLLNNQAVFQSAVIASSPPLEKVFLPLIIRNQE